MNNGQNALVPTKQITFVVDTVRLASDGAGVTRDLRAVDFLQRSEIRNCFFPTDNPGVAASFGADRVFLLVLAEHRKGQIREFRFMRGEDKPMNQIDDGDVFFSPESVDNDGMLNFECRSKRHPMKWYFSCKPNNDASGNGAAAKAAAPAPARDPSPQPAATAVELRTEAVKPVVAEEPAATSQPSQERIGEIMANQQALKNPKALVAHLFIECCKAFNADKAEAETGARGDNNCCTNARRGTIYLAKESGVPTSVISSVKGMPSQSNTSTQYGLAKAAYDENDGKNDFAKTVKAVMRAVPEELLGREEDQASADAGGLMDSKSNLETKPQTRHRGPNKKKHTSASRTHSVAKSEASSKSAVNGHVSAEDYLLYVLAGKGTKPAKLAEAFNLNESDVATRVGVLFCAAQDTSSPFGALMAKVRLAEGKPMVLE